MTDKKENFRVLGVRLPENLISEMEAMQDKGQYRLTKKAIVERGIQLALHELQEKIDSETNPAEEDEVWRADTFGDGLPDVNEESDHTPVEEPETAGGMGHADDVF